VAPPCHRGVAVLLIRDDAVLLAQRADNRDWAPGGWDAPGGHVEVNETEAEAAVREAWEELGIDVELGAMIGRLSGPEFEIAYFVVCSWVGSPRNAAPDEHTAVQWFRRGELENILYADENILSIIYRALEGSADGR
jgi:8-oxo-dGTP pyrophosphatase MutT (NUDIX family)